MRQNDKRKYVIEVNGKEKTDTTDQLKSAYIEVFDTVRPASPSSHSGQESPLPQRTKSVNVDEQPF